MGNGTPTADDLGVEDRAKLDEALDAFQRASRFPAPLLLRMAIDALRRAEVQDRHNSLAITNAEQALLWSQAEPDL